ncbi:MAG: hypothetical protein ACQGVK_00175 [Myxococcota bacterium]
MTGPSTESSDLAGRSPRALGLPGELEAAGFNVAGALSAEAYDRMVPPPWRCAALLPEARRALVLGCGGPAFGRAVLGSPEAEDPDDPIDRFAARVVADLGRALERSGGRSTPLYAYERRGGTYADFVGLARAAGLGEPSRLGQLLHPSFGPWLSIRAVVLTSADGPTTGPLRGFDPCQGCPAPCQSACPVGAPGDSGFQVGVCADYRGANDRCLAGCAARRACPVGGDHAYLPRIERLHMAASARWLAGARETEES